ncbi:hypothetical protein ACHAW6_013728 [Cyclotella cf. meneghiniana]
MHMAHLLETVTIVPPHTPTSENLTVGQHPTNQQPTEEHMDDVQPNKTVEPSDDDSMSSECLTIPDGCLFDNIRPDSPTAVTDFPKCNTSPKTVQLAETLQLMLSTVRPLPMIKRTTVPLQRMVNEVLQTVEPVKVEDNHPPTQVMAPTMVADVGRYGRTYFQQATLKWDRGKMADSGANCCMTNNWNLLQNIEQLEQPVQVGMALEQADSHIDMTMCQHVGDLPIECDDGHWINQKSLRHGYRKAVKLALRGHSPSQAQG